MFIKHVCVCVLIYNPHRATKSKKVVVLGSLGTSVGWSVFFPFLSVSGVPGCRSLCCIFKSTWWGISCWDGCRRCWLTLSLPTPYSCLVLHSSPESCSLFNAADERPLMCSGIVFDRFPLDHRQHVCTSECNLLGSSVFCWYPRQNEDFSIWVVTHWQRESYCSLTALNWTWPFDMWKTFSKRGGCIPGIKPTSKLVEE